MGSFFFFFVKRPCEKLGQSSSPKTQSHSTTHITTGATSKGTEESYLQVQIKEKGKIVDWWNGGLS